MNWHKSSESFKYRMYITINMSLLMYKYRLYPSRKQKVKIINSFKTCKSIYNELLAMNIDSYKFGKVSLNKFDFNKYLTGKYSQIHSQSKQNVSDRVHKAFSNFFLRVKSKEKKKGFPRFKSRVNSITFPQSGFKLLSDKRIRISKIGNIPLVLHRVPKGKIKTLTIKVNKVNQWFATFACEMPTTRTPIAHSMLNSTVGIDMGLENFAILSDGISIPNPRYLVKSEYKIRRLQRRLSRKKKGSNNRRKAKFRLARQHLKVANIRTDWLHKLSKSLTLRYGIIAVEKLNIKSMVKNHYLAKSINDAAWSQFLQMLPYKAVKSGGEIREVEARGTTSECFCGQKVDMPLSKRIFHCPSCGLTEHRDIKSSYSICDRAGLARIYACGDTVRPSLKASVVESGTTYGSTSS